MSCHCSFGTGGCLCIQLNRSQNERYPPSNKVFNIYSTLHQQGLLAIDYMDVVKGVRSFGCLRAAYLQPHALLWHDVAYN